MLIAIMGDTYAQASENKENNARITKLEIMEDYIHLIVHDIKNSNREITSEEVDEDSSALVDGKVDEEAKTKAEDGTN